MKYKKLSWCKLQTVAEAAGKSCFDKCKPAH